LRRNRAVEYKIMPMGDGFTILTADRVKAGDVIPPLAVEVTATTVILGALATRDTRPMHHDRDFARRQGVRDIFLNTPNQAAWFERYLTDWTGPLGRLGRMKFKMRTSVCPGDTMVFRGVVTSVTRDGAGCWWADVDVSLTVGGETATAGSARIALPAHESDNPWKRRGADWQP
jgi:acyl dehydratase